MNMTIAFVSGGEIFVILLVVLLLFGSKRIPELARGLGKGMNEFKKATNEIKKEIHKDNSFVAEIKEVKKFTDDMKKDLTDNSITKDINEIKSIINNKIV